MTPAGLEARALAAGASPEAAAAARAFVEALPEGTKMPTLRLDSKGDARLTWGDEDFVAVMLFGPAVCSRIGGQLDGEFFDWRPGQPVPARVMDLIGRVAG